MNKVKPTVISIGYGRHMFRVGDVERSRMKLCAQETAAFHMIVFSLKKHNLTTQTVDEKLTIYPTDSLSKLTMIFDAFKIVTKLIRVQEQKIVVTTQDAFESGLVGFYLQKKFNIHFTVQEHGDVFRGSYWRNESVGNWLRFYLGKYILRQADTVRVVSQRIKTTLSQMNLSANITKLPVAVNLNAVVVSNKESKFDCFTEEAFIFLTVARFVKQKNLILMVKAFSIAFRKDKKLRLVIVGRGQERSVVEETIAREFVGLSELPVKILDWSDDVSALMLKADAYLLSSNYEGWARVLIEALVYELPVVTTDVGCVGEVVLNNVHGYVVPIGQLASLTSAISKMATDKNMYRQFKAKLASLSKVTIAGADISDYGRRWVETLR